ncbi:major facilitator superfamily domain-containing protein [Cantharellus anzutake]|uniref:major facilitator superfamily domain-containing protein n=1 Tax=Cantharellus anzutake TaxID=1750568 RepID=UPI00190710E4|nr:major facilitator superfamily domain-containing protein [Cantharellus anzutake]KAF8326873.1 major facilitator superfamily domain-containing protein [Cantharellus anzutake]
MFINDPLEPWRQYSNKFIITGMGLFVEGFTLFSIGNLTPLFAAVWPKCWGSKPTQCTKTWVEAVSYLEIIGIIIGQILVGIEGDWIGRKFGLVQDALIMSLGTIMLISVWGTSLQGWVIAYGWSLFVYGIGVGGEYPMTSTSTMEGSSSATSGDRLHRGRNVVLPFLMQGWGQLFNQTILILLLLMFHSQAGPPYTETSAQYIYRVSFAAILPFTLYLAYWRAYKVGYGAANGELMRSRKRTGRTGGYDIISLKLCITHYWGRLFATAFGWFANDFAFYGNKIFQSNFIAVIVPHTHNINIGWLWNLINVGVAMFGYYFAALLIDYKPFGRNKMQILGFLGDFICFVIPAAMYNQLTKRGSGIHWFQSLYFLSSFFQQFGPNCTTFLVAAEVYPASIRSTAHGFSAAAGKLGALAPTILYNYIGSRTRFWVVSWFGLAGAIVTWLFLPDVTGLDLREQERYWEYVRAGRADEYHGVAIHPRHLSVWERVVLKRHRNYDPEKDRESKIAELRKLFELREGDKAREVSGNHDDDDLLSDEVAEYFRREKGIVGVKRG